ncbi:MAG: hypothetical protein GY869_08755 [Planctomycetes bacterium]|nr:hypothetical protein [Planctomycetota bacterium]
MKKSQIPVIVIFGLFGLLFCGMYVFSGPKINKAILVGFYEGGYSGFARVDLRPGSVYNQGYHFLELKADGTYTYLYQPLEGESYYFEDKWSYSRAGLKHRIKLQEIDTAKLSELPTEEVVRSEWFSASVDRLSAKKIGLCIDGGGRVLPDQITG